MCFCWIWSIYAQTPSPIDQRVSELLSKMSLSDKAAELNSQHGAKATTIYGMVDYADVTNSCGKNITCRIVSRNQFQSTQMKTSSLNIPVSFRIEGLHSSGPGGTMLVNRSLYFFGYYQFIM